MTRPEEPCRRSDRGCRYCCMLCEGRPALPSGCPGCSNGEATRSRAPCWLAGDVGAALGSSSGAGRAGCCTSSCTALGRADRWVHCRGCALVQAMGSWAGSWWKTWVGWAGCTGLTEVGMSAGCCEDMWVNPAGSASRYMPETSCSSEVRGETWMEEAGCTARG